MIQQFHFWVYSKKNWKQGLQEIFVQRCSQHYSQQPKVKTQMFINRWLDQQNIIYTYNGILFNLEKEQISDTFYNMDNLEDKKCKTSQTQMDRYCMIPLTWGTYSNQIQGNRIVVIRGLEKRRETYYLMRTQFQFGFMRSSTMWKYLMPLNSPLKNDRRW